MKTEVTVSPPRAPEQTRSENSGAEQARERRKASEAELNEKTQERRQTQLSSSQERAVDLEA
jgi:hypothetical protein